MFLYYVTLTSLSGVILYYVTLTSLAGVFLYYVTLTYISGVFAGLIIKLVGVSVLEPKATTIGTCDNVTYNFTTETLPYYLTTGTSRCN